MTDRSEAFRRQSRSDLEAFEVLAAHDCPSCHALHYLQMCTEKLGKAVRVAAGQSGAEQHSHVAIVKALRLLRNQGGAARALTNGDVTTLRSVVDRVLPLAGELERLAPAIANGPNPEYPWPVGGDEDAWVAPVDHEFALHQRVRGPEGRRLIQLLARILDRFDEVFTN